MLLIRISMANILFDTWLDVAVYDLKILKVWGHVDDPFRYLVWNSSIESSLNNKEKRRIKIVTPYHDTEENEEP